MDLAEKLRYDETSPTGLVWAVNGPGIAQGKVAGKIVTKSCGRQVAHVMVFGKQRLAHRVVWELHNGPIPDGIEIDHIDGDPTNNVIENLRLATRSVNTRNRKKLKSNKTGITGVSCYTDKGVIIWKASWREGGKNRSKSFSEGSYGPAAKDLAIAKRAEEVGKSEDYTERHGL